MRAKKSKYTIKFDDLLLRLLNSYHDVDASEVRNITLMGIINVTSVASRTLKIQGKNSGGTQVNIGDSSNTGTANVTWTIFPISQQFPQAVVLQNVETGATGDCLYGNICSGTYTPTCSGASGGTIGSCSDAQYMRVGNVVTVSGRANFDPSSAGATCGFDISLPIASAFTNAYDAGGALGCPNCKGFEVYADTGGDEARVRGQFDFNTGFEDMSYTYTYQIK